MGHLGREWAASLLTVVDTVGTGDGLEKEGVVEDRLRVSALAPRTETRQQTSVAWCTVAHSSHCTSENKWREAHRSCVGGPLTLVIGPAWSRIGSKLAIPVYGTSPVVGFRPTIPLQQLGRRIEPP